MQLLKKKKEIDASTQMVSNETIVNESKQQTPQDDTLARKFKAIKRIMTTFISKYSKKQTSNMESGDVKTSGKKRSGFRKQFESQRIAIGSPVDGSFQHLNHA